MVKHIYIIRHGQTDFNKYNIIQGSGVDSELNAEGIAQAGAFYNHYKHIPFEVIMSSVLKRSKQTIQNFLTDGRKFESYKSLNEINWGIHEGMPASLEMKQSYNRLLDNWRNGNYMAKIKEGESASEMANRLSKFVDLLKARPERKILICTHGRALRCLICLMKQQPLFYMESNPHSNTGLYIVKQIENSFQFELENDREHLKLAQLIS